ncbi:hypothetical protein MUG91_G8n50 [Manis pentadactyla]|nr:hypothetical protein MUG91_G8n50 [Manis pentadactyla]
MQGKAQPVIVTMPWGIPRELCTERGRVKERIFIHQRSHFSQLGYRIYALSHLKGAVAGHVERCSQPFLLLAGMLIGPALGTPSARLRTLASPLVVSTIGVA